MIVVFVVDTSPSMRQPLQDTAGMSRLDLAKMAVEDIMRGLNKRVTEHNGHLQQQPQIHQNLRTIGLGLSPNDEFLLLSTGRQHSQQPATAACGAGGRLLVGYGDHSHQQALENSMDQPVSHHSNVDSFQKELKCLQATDWTPGKMGPNNKPMPFPDDGGGSAGLNIALSVGLQMLSRYRLHFRSTENYGMGRLPSPAVLNPSGGGPAVHAIQSACLIVITDGSCLSSSPNEGGGPLQLQYGKMPLREFYKEPFRWDQRIFCLGVGGKDGVDSTQFLHPHLRTLCEVTGGSHMMLRSSASLALTTDLLLKMIAPPRPRDLPIPDPLQFQTTHAPLVGSMGTFISGGPVCCFQALEGDLDTAQTPPKHRALLLYVPHESASNGTNETQAQVTFQPPIWCLPESYFPSKMLDSLPPRSAQPNLLFSRFPSRLGSKSFEPAQVLKALNRLDQLVISNRKHISQSASQIKLLSRDVYICEWISADGKSAQGPKNPMSLDYFPVVVPGAARQSLGDGEISFLNIGILHVPSGTSTLGSSLQSGARVSTLTLLPPEPHVLLPLLIRAAEAEHRALKKVTASESKESSAGVTSALAKKYLVASRNVNLDEHWRIEFRAYLFRIPPYYQVALRRSLRGVLPSSAHSLLNADGPESSLVSQCFSKLCLQKIRNAEQSSRENNERLERQEAELRRTGFQMAFEGNTKPESQHPQKRSQIDSNKCHPKAPLVGYGQFDPRSTTDSYLAALKGMPAPWRVGAHGKAEESEEKVGGSRRKPADVLGELPSECLMAYYESRRRWIFGGSGLTTRAIFVEGVPNDGSNMQQCAATRDPKEESLLSIADVGVSQLNATTTAKMGDYRERLLWSRAPVVGYGSNDSVGVSATTAVDGSAKWSVDDDAMPVTFFNPRTGEFADSVQARVRSRLLVNFGNPYRDRRADSLIPEEFLDQSPSSRKGIRDGEDSPMTPPGSPPHDSYSETEGEGAAVFAHPIARIHKSLTRNDAEDTVSAPEAKKQRMESTLSTSTKYSVPTAPNAPPPPPPPPPLPQSTQERSAIESPKPQPPPTTRVTATPPPPPKLPVKTPMPPGGQVQKVRPVSLPGKIPPPPKPPLKKALLASERPPAPPTRPNPPPTKPSQPPKNADAGPDSQQRPPERATPPKRQAATSTEGVEMQSPDQKPNVDLPPGWMTVWSKSQKRWYFFSTKTNKSVWQWPPP